jgi:hypothetical protein
VISNEKQVFGFLKKSDNPVFNSCIPVASHPVSDLSLNTLRTLHLSTAKNNQNQTLLEVER